MSFGWGKRSDISHELRESLTVWRSYRVFVDLFDQAKVILVDGHDRDRDLGLGHDHDCGLDRARGREVHADLDRKFSPVRRVASPSLAQEGARTLLIHARSIRPLPVQICVNAYLAADPSFRVPQVSDAPRPLPCIVSAPRFRIRVYPLDRASHSKHRHYGHYRLLAWGPGFAGFDSYHLSWRPISVPSVKPLEPKHSSLPLAGYWPPGRWQAVPVAAGPMVVVVSLSVSARAVGLMCLP